MNRLVISASAAMLFFPVALAHAEEISPQSFVERAAQSDIFEIAAAKLVIDHGQSAEVKAFAMDMVRDHHESSKELKAAASKDGATLPAATSPELAKKLESLKPLSGPALDAAYVSTQVSVHTQAVALFEQYSKDGKSGAVRSFATNVAPTIRMHLIRVRNFNVEN